eukprot:TRINITY_DN4776_c1_g2_i1.p1 TRINITY_DN4776_c1_g2~~TRINITY_DN4776_c1_g2_i1.p1  ORF type:complete len:1515 (+),score=303.88 TRINITY_DN4776_c1_g2_i1:282-4547(+)
METERRSTRGGRRTMNFATAEDVHDSIMQAFKEHNKRDAESCCSGLLHDFIQRHKTEMGMASKTPEEWFNQYASILLDASMWNMAQGMLYQEQLYSVWFTAVVQESKERGIFPKTGSGAVMEQVKFVRQIKRESVTIRTMVENWQTVQKMIRTVKAAEADHAYERADKLGDLWASKMPVSRHDSIDEHSLCLSESGEFPASSRSPSPGKSLDIPTFYCPVKAMKGMPPPRTPFKFEHLIGGDVRNRVLKDRGRALYACDLAPEQLSDQKPSNNPLKRDLGWIETKHQSSAELATMKDLRSRPTSSMKWSSSRPGSSYLSSRPSTGRSLNGVAASRPGSALKYFLDADGNESVLGGGGDTRNLLSPSLTASASLPSLRRQGSGTRGHQRLAERHRPSLHPESPGLSNSRSRLPALQDRYIKTCKTKYCVPTPVSFVVQESNRFDGRGLMDAELKSVTGILKTAPELQSVTLANNSFVHDKTIGSFLRRLHEYSHKHLLELNLGQCSRAGLSSLSASIELAVAAEKLKFFDISGMPVSTNYQRVLCDGIGDHPCLETINLAGTGLGGNRHTAECLRKLFASPTLTSVDLGWNCFDANDFDVMGAQVAAKDNLKYLAVDNTSSAMGNSDCAVTRLIEWMAYDNSLGHFSCAMNRMDFKAGLVVEDSLEVHKKLRSINISHNPLGSLGLRSLLRLISRKSNFLKHFEAEGCFTGAPDADDMMHPDSKLATTCKVFSFTNPGGRYKLDLARPYHRTLLRMLYKTCDRYKVSVDKPFQELSYSLGQYTHATKDSNGVFNVAKEGVLSLYFNLESEIEENMKGIRDDDFLGFLKKHFSLTRFEPDPAKVTPLFAKWLELYGRSMDQTVFLDAMCKDFNMSIAYIDFMCQSARTTVCQTMNSLLPCIPDDGASRFLAMHQFPKIQDFCKTYVTMEALLLFNVQNPTGHYKLDLENSPHHAVAQRLLLLDRWESVVNKRYNRVDISSMGNKSHARNELIGGQPLLLRARCVAEWNLPEADEFELDYVTSYRTPANAIALTDELWEELMVSMYESKCNPPEKLKVMRSISHNIFITSKHMRQMVGYFSNPKDREEAFVMFYTRIVDMYNIKLCRVRFGKAEEIERLMHRLGHAFFFPFFQPENAIFDLDLTKNDHRLCGNMVVGLAQREKASNIRDAVWIREDGTVDDFPMGVPRSWETSIPTSGNFKCRYVCSADDRQFAYRKSLAQKYGYLPLDPTNDDILWWTGLNEPPDDVLDLLEFFISRVKNMQEAFEMIDGGEPGTTSNSELTLREFEEGLKSMECTKFEGPDEKARIAAVFRYLDPGGEGSVSLAEWSVLEELWREFDLTIREFVQFLAFAFGPSLEDAWAVLDDDGSGELSEEEFNEAVKSIGYFGPARVVFALLDGSDDGNISFDEFIVLEKYKPTPKEDR